MLDLKREQAKSVLRRLVRGADVFVHNMRAQAIGKLGFDYAAVAAEKPDTNRTPLFVGIIVFIGVAIGLAFI